MNSDAFVTAASVLFGFLFAGFWWALDRELKFCADKRHFKPGYGLLLASMAILAWLGIIRPLHQTAQAEKDLVWTARGLTLVIVGIFGYMLTEFGHYRIFQRPKYTTKSEVFLLASTLLVCVSLCVYWFWIG